MDWSNERFVRLYTRDTTTWKLIDWRARTTLVMLLRKVDRAGVLDVGGDGIDGLAAVLELPLEVVEPGIEQLLRRRSVEQSSTAFVLPNFIEAQETPMSDPQRKRESRANRKDRTLAEARGLLLLAAGPVTKPDESSRNVTIKALPAPVTKRDHSGGDASGEEEADAITTSDSDFTAAGPVTKPDESSRNVTDHVDFRRTPGGSVTRGHSGPSPSPSPDHLQTEREPARARAIPPSTEYDANDPRQRGRLAEATYSRVSAVRMEIAAELKLADTLPLPAGVTGSEPRGFRDLRDRIREEGSLAPQVCDRVLENLITQARVTGSVEWLSEKVFTEGGWRTAREGPTSTRTGARGAYSKPDEPPHTIKTYT